MHRTCLPNGFQWAGLTYAAAPALSSSQGVVSWTCDTWSISFSLTCGSGATGHSRELSSCMMQVDCLLSYDVWYIYICIRYIYIYTYLFMTLQVLLIQWNACFDLSVEKHFVELFAGCSSASKAWSWPHNHQDLWTCDMSILLVRRHAMGFSVAHFDLEYGQAK